MDTSPSWIKLLVGLLLSGICVQPSFSFPPKHSTPHASHSRPGVTKQTVKEQAQTPAPGQEQVTTVRVTCLPDSLEIVIQADMFDVGLPVYSDDIRLGVEPSDVCTASASSGEEYTIVAGLVDCGTKRWMTEDSLVYTNLLIYAPAPSPDGLIRMDEAVIPIECHYQRKYSLSSSSLVPTWIPFMSTQAAEESLDFDLRIMTNDWMHERRSSEFLLGERISMEASIRIGNHMGLRVFLSSCVATLQRDVNSSPRYVFIEDGCLTDSQLAGSRSHFLPRTRDNKLHLVIDAFMFHNENGGELYITCHLNAVPVNDAQAPNKACTFKNGRWRSADGNDYLCGHCLNQNEVGQTHSRPSSPAKFSPRGFGKPVQSEALLRTGSKTNRVREQEARVGPILVWPAMQGSEPLPVEKLPLVLNKIGRPALYGSQWRGGIINKIFDVEKELLPDQKPTPDESEAQTSEQNGDVKGGENEDEEDEDLDEDEDEDSDYDYETDPVITSELMAPEMERNDTAVLGGVGPTSLALDVTMGSNTTTTESGLSHTNDTKR